MNVNSVIVNGETLIDLSNDTVTKDILLQGYVAHNASGEKIIGEMTNNADTVDGLHFKVSTTEAFLDDRTIITFVI